jgi:thiol:disulfide interchange protein DsbD
MHTLKVTLGFVEVAAALKFFSNAELVWQWRALPRELFLWLWAGILLITAIYLLGLIRLKDDAEPGAEAPRGIGSGRLIAGTAFALFAIYCAFGAAGNKLHWIMVALAPPYSERIDYAAKPRIVYDDFEGAIALALAEHKQVLINFTGFT